ncbi:MAG: MFS transporter [Burkholderiales bacterium]|jgi:MFS family permease|nr:MAG: MFS transporter [Burkholderiales bacterium]
MKTDPDRTRASRAQDARVVGVVGVAHALSHFSQLLLAPLFPWLKDAFALSYAELGLLMTIFFVVSGIGQSLAGFVVDRVGALPVMLGSIALFALAAVVFALSNGYVMLGIGALVAGLGNASFHPVDYSILNARISHERIGHAYAAHGVSGNLGWAAAPVFLVTIAQFAGWRMAFAGASLVALVVLVVVWWHRDALETPPHVQEEASAAAGDTGAFDFLRLPAVWLGFAFFCAYAFALGGVQSFAPEAARLLHGVPIQAVAWCLTAFMLASAGGTLVGGFMAGDPERAERVIAACFGIAVLLALSLAWLPWPGVAVPFVFAAMGAASGLANPSRDMLIRRATPPGATGRVYGVVYSGLDLGTSTSPLLFGMLMDAHSPSFVFVGIAAAQALLILGAFRTGRATRVRGVAPEAA